MTNYFGITAYYEKEDLSVIIDSNRMLENFGNSVLTYCNRT